MDWLTIQNCLPRHGSARAKSRHVLCGGSHGANDGRVLEITVNTLIQPREHIITNRGILRIAVFEWILINPPKKCLIHRFPLFSTLNLLFNHLQLDYDTVPRSFYTRPHVIHTAPQAIDAVPRKTDAVPHVADRAPRSIYTNPWPIYTVPQAIYTVPRTVDTVPPAADIVPRIKSGLGSRVRRLGFSVALSESGVAKFEISANQRR